MEEYFTQGTSPTRKENYRNSSNKGQSKNDHDHDHGGSIFNLAQPSVEEILKEALELVASISVNAPLM